MSRFRFALSTAVATVLLVPAAAQAQRAMPAAFAPASYAPVTIAPAADVATPSTLSDAPTLSRAVADSAVADAKDAREASARMSPSDHANVGPNIGLMIVGGAAIVTGAVVGGSAGTVLVVGGAAVGLYGLWRYVH